MKLAICFALAFGMTLTVAPDAEARTPKDVMKVWKTKKAAMKKCYEKSAASRSGETVRLKAKFTVTAPGTVKSLSLSGNGGDSLLKKCLGKTIMRMRFAKADKDLTVRMPILLKP